MCRCWFQMCGKAVAELESRPAYKDYLTHAKPTTHGASGEERQAPGEPLRSGRNARGIDGGADRRRQTGATLHRAASGSGARLRRAAEAYILIQPKSARSKDSLRQPLLAASASCYSRNHAWRNLCTHRRMVLATRLAARPGRGRSHRDRDRDRDRQRDFPDPQRNDARHRLLAAGVPGLDRGRMCCRSSGP